MAQNKICQAHIEGLPKIHVSGFVGSPKPQLPKTAPGPIPKKNHNKVIIQAIGIKFLFSDGTPAYSLRKLWNFILCANSSLFWVKNETIIAPFKGVLGKREIAQGVLGTESFILTLDDTSSIILNIKVPEIYLKILKPGLIAEVRSDAFDKKLYPQS